MVVPPPPSSSSSRPAPANDWRLGDLPSPGGRSRRHTYYGMDNTVQRSYYIFAEQLALQERIASGAPSADASTRPERSTGIVAWARSLLHSGGAAGLGWLWGGAASPPPPSPAERRMTLDSLHRTLNHINLYAVGTTGSGSGGGGKKGSEQRLTWIVGERGVSRGEAREIFDTVATSPEGLTFSEFHHIYACLHMLGELMRMDAVTVKGIEARLVRAGLAPEPAVVEKLFELGDSVRTRDTMHLSLAQFVQLYMHAEPSPQPKFIHSWFSSGRNSTPYSMPLELTPSQDAMGGHVAGIATTLVGHPFDTVKVRMQLDSQFRSVWHCVKKSISRSTHGPLVFFHGMSGPIALIPIANAIVYPMYTWAKEIIHQTKLVDNRLSKGEVAAAGAFAGFCTSFAITPIELIKVRLQVQYLTAKAHRYTGPIDCARRILVRRGVPGLFRGLAATVAREVPGMAGQFYAYEAIKSWVVGPRAHKDMTSTQVLLAGGAAGSFGWLVSYPCDYVKTRLQVERSSVRYKQNVLLLDGGFIDCWQQTVRDHGHARLWRGVGPALARAFPANAAGFFAYEAMVKVFAKYDS